MRIAYITPYQGPGVLRQRPIMQSRSLATTTKVELIASLLRSNGHDVELFSQGEVIENSFKFYPGFAELERFEANIPIFYSSAWPIKRVNGFWSCFTLKQLFNARHRASPFDLAIIWNLKRPQIVCALHAMKALDIPAILEYEDDAFLSLDGSRPNHSARQRQFARDFLEQVPGCMACSPHLLSQLPSNIPKLLLRGVVGRDLEAARDNEKANRVLFSGSHHKQYGIPALIAAWTKASLPNWELHITGGGPETASFRKLAESDPTIHFHGFVSRAELVKLMASAKICINPHDTSKTPGNVFAFKIVEYLASGAHVITTPMGPLEKELEQGITYMADNSPETIGSTLRRVIDGKLYERTGARQVLGVYGPAACAKSLEAFIQTTITQFEKRSVPCTSCGCQQSLSPAALTTDKHG
jgi:glycosyltransferase involved in cell wall biosynthesis